MYEDSLFLIKKVISPFLMPLPLGLLIFLIGLTLLLLHKTGIAKLALCISFVWIFLISYSPFSNILIEPLELKYQPIKNYENIRINYILLLGGDFDSKAYEAVKIYNRIYGSRIIISSYPGESSVTERQVNMLNSMGINQEDILILNNTRNTLEEAKTAKLILGDEWFILIASAYHMPRAVDIFRGEGLNPLPAPANYLTRQKNYLLLPNGYELIKSERAFHEYLGKYWIKVKS